MTTHIGPRTLSAAHSPTDEASGPSLWTIAAAELIRLRRRTFARVALITTVAAVVLVQTISLFETGAEVTAIEAPAGYLHGLVSGSELLGLIFIGLWAAAVSADYSNGWIRHLVSAEPRRWRVLAGKVAAMLLVTSVLIAVAVATATALAWPAAGVANVDTAQWRLTEAPSVWLNLTVGGAVWGAIGLSIAAITRSTIAAVIAGVAYMLVFETLLVIISPNATTYLPGQILSTVGTGGTAELGYRLATGLAVGIALASLAVANLVFNRREIAD